MFRDERGSFVKTFHQPRFRELGLTTDYAETYHSTSKRGVLRGMHFQTPPHHHAKLVYCVAGEVMDAVVDLRRGSPTYGWAATFALSAQEGNLLYVPPGLAHGFLAVSEGATLVYNVTTVHAPEHDAGVRWDSVGVAWPVEAPVLSARDAAFPRLEDFESPFAYDPTALPAVPHG